METGAGVAAFTVGERVFGISSLDPLYSDQAGLQEYAVLNANAIGKTPDGFSDEQVVTLPINLVTSWTVLFTQSGFDIPPPIAQQKDFAYSSTSIVITGGGTNVGQLAVQLARIAGIGKVIVIAGLSNTAQLKSVGGTHVIDRHGSPADITQQIHDITGQEDVTQVYSCAQLQVDLALAMPFTD
jgi:NADPH:quinone reductase